MMFFAAAGVGIGILALSVGLSVASALFLKKKKQGYVADQEPSTTASRGDYVPRLLGRRRVGPVIGWVGNQNVTKDGGGKKAKGGEKVKTFWEDAIHWLAVGPGSQFFRIFMDGKIIYDTAINPSSHASGTQIDITGVNGVDNAQGSFVIYWGESSQPVNTDFGLSTNNPPVNINSRWPYILYVHWKSKMLGLFPRWPNIEYEIEVLPTFSTTWITGSPVTTGTGVNPAHIIAELLFADFPHGMGKDSNRYDLNSLEEVAATLNTEGIAGSIIIKNGNDIKEAIATLMVDMGLFIVPDCTTGLLKFKLIREPDGNIPIVPDESILNGEPEIEKRLSVKPQEKLVFSFASRVRKYRQDSIVSDDDGVVKLTKTKRGRTISIGSTVEFDSASKIALRRAQEELGEDSKFDVEVNHEARNILPGDSIFIAGIPVSLRVLGSKPYPTSAKTELECVADFYGLAPTDFTNPGGDIQYPDLDPTDPEFHYLERPGWGNPGTPGPGPGPGGPGNPGGGPGGTPGPGPGAPGGAGVIGVGRRKSSVIIIDEEYISEDNTSFTPLGPITNHAAGGLLKTELNATSSYLDSFEVLLDDLDQDIIQNLETTPEKWYRGEQVLIIGNEIMFLKKVATTGGANHEMVGVIRGRLSTPVEAHSVDDQVFIMPWEDVATFQHPAMLPDTTLWFKSQPVSIRGGYDLSLVTSKSLTIYGNSYRPLPVLNLRSDAHLGNYNVWVSGNPLVFRWYYRGPKTHRTGAGEQGYGEVVQAPTDFQGYFILEVLEAGVVLITKTNITNTLIDVSWAELTSAFGTPPSQFQVRVRHIVGNFVSSNTEIDINQY